MFIPPNLSVAEVKQPHIKLFLYRPAYLLLSQLVVKLMRQCLRRIETLLGGVDHDLVDEIEEEGVCFGEHLSPFPAFYLRELIVIQVVFRIHLDHLRLGGSAKHLDDLNQVVDAAFTHEERCPVEHFE